MIGAGVGAVLLVLGTVGVIVHAVMTSTDL
jgi:hypothetical protein